MSCFSLTLDHVQRKRRFRKGGSNSTLSMLRKELREGSLQSLFGGSTCIVSSNTEPDPLLSSFIYNAPIVDESVSVQSHSLVEARVAKENSKEDFLESWCYLTRTKRRRLGSLSLSKDFCCPLFSMIACEFKGHA
uniref:Di19 C-terminal domain-containing protein n=1 Tax=Fagus sylvatica TaxID=28930 RepID=A0A2N9EZ69_FAGSY